MMFKKKNDPDFKLNKMKLFDSKISSIFFNILIKYKLKKNNTTHKNKSIF